MSFALDARLQKDTFLIGSAPDMLLLLMNDSRYPWFIIVPSLPNISEWFDLPESRQIDLHLASVKLGQSIQRAFECEKLNIASLGNIVRQMHVHVVGRHENDAAWPGPVWGHSPAMPYSEQQRKTRTEMLFAQMDLPFTPT